MGWIYSEPVHEHNTPRGDSHSRPVGSIWECSCGEWFRLIQCRSTGDQRDDWFYFKWEDLKKGDRITLNNGSTTIVGTPHEYNGIYAPGTK